MYSAIIFCTELYDNKKSKRNKTFLWNMFIDTNKLANLRYMKSLSLNKWKLPQVT